METIHVKFDELTAIASEHDCLEPELQRFNNQNSSDDLMNTPSKEDLDNLFGPMFEDYFEQKSSDTTINSAAQPTHDQEDLPSTSSIIVDTHEAPPVVTTSDEQTSLISLQESDEFNQEDSADFDGVQAVHCFAAHMNITYLQMDSNAYLNGPLKEEVYVSQPEGFIDPEFPDHVYRRHGGDIILQVYVDDIIFGSTNPDFSKRFANLMKKHFEMSMMGELKFILGLQVHQSPRGIFISQSQYAIELLKKHGLDECVSMSTSMATERLDVDLQGYLFSLIKRLIMDGIFLSNIVTCKYCGNGAHIGYNCPPKVPIISNPEQCNQTINELPQTLPSVHPTCNSEDENSFTYDSKPNSFNITKCFSPTSTNSSFGELTCFPVNYPPQETSREILQDQGDLMKAIQAFLKEYDHIPPNEKCMALLLAEERSLTIKQVMREEQNQPEVMQELLLKLMDDLQILKGSQQEKKETAAQSFIPYWNSSMIDNEEARDNFLKDVYTFLRKFSRIPFGVTPKVILIAWESFGEIKDALMDKQYRQEDIQELISKLLEDVRNISEEPKDITSDEPSEDPLIMGGKELSTIPEKDKSSVEDLVPIPSGSKGVSDDIYDPSDAESLLSQDIPITSPKIDFLSEEFAGEFAPIPPGMDEDEFDEEEVDCYDHDISSDDESYENIEYVEASPLNLEYDSLEEENEDQEEKEFDLEDIFQIQDVILREKLLNVHRLITNIESLKNNPTPDHVLKSSSSFSIPVTDSDSFFEESDTFLSHSDNSLPEFETFSDHTEETRSGSTTTHANNIFRVIVISDNSNDPLLELPEFESFHFDLDPSFPRPPPEPPDVEISLIIETDAHVINDFDELNEDECFDPGGGEINVEVDDSFTFVTWTFLPFLTYPEVSPLLSSTKNEDTIFDPGIST
ncbi:retrovirus-related pol polyprotein from transposon TNT 1-94 [Tanacetum coccineum]